MPIPTNPIEYLVYRLQGRWELREEDIKIIGKALYNIEPPAPSADDLALMASELPDELLDDLLIELPPAVNACLDDIPC